MASSKLKAVAVVVLAGVTLSSATVRAEDWKAREAELLGLHQLCDKGDRRACVRFGMMLGEAKAHHADWRRNHPEFWWWEH